MLTDTQLEYLIVGFQAVVKEKSASIHQKECLAALLELKELRAKKLCECP